MDLRLAIVCGLLTAVGFAFEWSADQTTPLAWAIYAVAYLAGSIDLLVRTFEAIRSREFRPDIDLLMLVAALGAAAIGHPAEGAFLLFLFSLANALEHRAMDRARRAIAGLAELAPSTAIVIDGNEERVTPIDQVRVGDRVRIKPGMRLPVDGVVVEGMTSIDQSPITGESVPVGKSIGDDVFAGSINADGSVVVRTTCAIGDRTLDRVIRLVEQSRAAKASTERFTERFERVFVPMVLVLDVLVIVVPPLMGWLSWQESVYRGMVLLTGASPCALALGTPATVLCGLARAARGGVLIKGGEHLENLARVRAIAIDKTGTLTTGKPILTDIRPADASPESLLSLVAGIERHSAHPLARAITDAATARGLDVPAATEIESVTARGVRGVVEGRRVEIGSAAMWPGVVMPTHIAEDARQIASLGQSVLIVRVDERFVGVMGVADQPRAASIATIRRLREIGIERIVMLTGDSKPAAEAIGRAVGVDEVRAGLLPHDKVEAVRELRHRHGAIAMVGDGVNDAPALAAATVGVAMGGASTAAALETADAALMSDDLSRLPFAIELSRKSARIIRQNIAIAISVIAMLIVLAIGGWVQIGPAVVLHEGSTLVVIANALRLLSFGKRGEAIARIDERASGVVAGAPQAALR